MSSANNTSNNNSRVSSVASGASNTNHHDATIYEDDALLGTQVNQSSGQFNGEYMDLDVNMDHLPIRHFEDVNEPSNEMNEIQVKISDLKTKIKGNEISCEKFNNDLQTALMLPIPDDDDELALADKKLASLSKRVELFKSTITSDMELLASYEKSLFNHQSRQKQLSVLSGKAANMKSYLDISEAQLPKFKITPLHERGTNTDKFFDESPLNDFIEKFERLYERKFVDVNKYWSFHLQTCFADDAAALNWYKNHIKNPRTTSWEAVKKLMQARFGTASDTDVIFCNERLSTVKQGRHEIFVEYLDRYINYLYAAKIKLDDCLYFVIHFKNSLYGTAIKDKITEILKEESYKSMIYKGTSTADSKYADDMHYIPSSFRDFETLMYKHKHVLGELSLEIMNKAKSNTPLNTTNASDNNNKKRKLVDTANTSQNKGSSSADVNDVSQLLSLLDLSTPLTKEQRQQFMNNGYCTFCRTAKYSKDHSMNRSVRKQYFDNRNKKVINAKNFIKTPVQSADKSVFYSRTTNNDVASSPLLNAADNVYDSDSSIDEFTAALIKVDQSLLDGTYDDKYNKNVFSISMYSLSDDKEVLTSSLTFPPKKRNNTIGEVDNPFETKNVAYAPISCITVNNVNSYCLIDTGAEISLITKDFAVKNNIKFHNIPAYLCVADGKKIPRQQTTEFLSIDYDGVEKTIPHKFDIIDNEQLVKGGKIIVGYDLLPKLNISLVNVAYKFKSTTKVDDAIDDKPYEPNVTPYGSNREQKAFFLAIEPYIEANKNLKPDSLCNCQKVSYICLQLMATTRM